MSQFDFDLFTIGGGSGGVRASRVAAGFGARAALAESGRLGGTCVNVGCIPKKLFSYAAHFREEFETAAGFGWKVPAPKFDWDLLRDNKDREIARLNKVYEQLLRNAGVRVFSGRARVCDAHTVEVDGARHSAKHILVATGSQPALPKIPGIELAISSNDAFHLKALPSRALVVGGGYIAVEFASIFNGLGVHSTLAHRRETLLRGFDGEIAKQLAAEMGRKGVCFKFGAEPLSLQRTASGDLETRFSDGSSTRSELVMFATGRRPNTGNLGLEAAGVHLAEDGAIRVNGYSTSTVASIHAIGDVTNRRNLTPVATADGMALAQTLFTGRPSALDYANIPTAVFSDPNLATVGLSEEAAREKHHTIDVYKAGFRSLKHTLTANEERITVKLIVDRTSQRVVGAHMLGPDAGEIIQGIAIAVKMGATKAQFDATIGIHPTAAEEFVTLREATG